ncbi:hypothetical protein [Asanoa siamensis]|nr:hypothetical protein [Asanoa siamensis]
MAVRLVEGGRTVHELPLAEGDGMCAGYHGWAAGDFGDAPQR